MTMFKQKSSANLLQANHHPGKMEIGNEKEEARVPSGLEPETFDQLSHETVEGEIVREANGRL